MGERGPRPQLRERISGNGVDADAGEICEETQFLQGAGHEGLLTGEGLRWPVRAINTPSRRDWPGCSALPGVSL